MGFLFYEECEYLSKKKEIKKLVNKANERIKIGK